MRRASPRSHPLYERLLRRLGVISLRRPATFYLHLSDAMCGHCKKFVLAYRWERLPGLFALSIPSSK